MANFIFSSLNTIRAARSVWTVQSCTKSECDFSRFAGLKVRTIYRSIHIGFTRFDELLGYIPREGFSAILNTAGKHGGKLTIRKDGFRSNGSEPPPLPAIAFMGMVIALLIAADKNRR